MGRKIAGMGGRQLLAALFPAIALVACGCRPDILNPSGSCTAPSGGGRAGYHVPGDDDVWLPDCANPLRREYWRVFAMSQTVAYTIPRMDGEPRLQPACADHTHPMAILVGRYGLCASATNQMEVTRVNNMAPVDALALTHFLHGQLVFHTTTAGLGIDPYPIPADVLDACGLHPSTNSPDLTTICTRERNRLQSGNDIGLAYTGAGGPELVDRLNELYGIAPP